jgi:nucleotidyltransferase substrate binding protein (TIGR01987 family)
MENKDIRWMQRFHNYRKALTKLTEVVDRGLDSLSELEIEGMIQRFEYTYELAWTTLQDLMRERGYPDIKGPGPVFEQALADGYIKGEQEWRKLKSSRQLTSHTYDEETASDIAESIIEVYHGLFVQLETRLQLEKIQQEKQS